MNNTQLFRFIRKPQQKPLQIPAAIRRVNIDGLINRDHAAFAVCRSAAKQQRRDFRRGMRKAPVIHAAVQIQAMFSGKLYKAVTNRAGQQHIKAAIVGQQAAGGVQQVAVTEGVGMPGLTLLRQGGFKMIDKERRVADDQLIDLVLMADGGKRLYGLVERLQPTAPPTVQEIVGGLRIGIGAKLHGSHLHRAQLRRHQRQQATAAAYIQHPVSSPDRRHGSKQQAVRADLHGRMLLAYGKMLAVKGGQVTMSWLYPRG